MKTRTEVITPERAKQLLALVNPQRQRKVKPNTVQQYAAAMRAGNWIESLDRIGISENGELVNGQHRLHAIILSGCTVTMDVATGVPDRVLDVADQGHPRTVSQQLALRHEMHNTVLVSSIARSIGIFAGVPAQRKISVASVLTIKRMYENEMRFVIEHRSNMAGMQRAPILAATAFAMHIPEYRNAVEEFYVAFAGAEGLKSGMPAHTLFKYVQPMYGKSSGGVSQVVVSRAAFVALKYHVQEQQLKKIYTDSDGPMQFFQSKQKRDCRLLLQALGEYKG